MSPLSAGSAAPDVLGVPKSEGPRVLFFYKVTCPVCQMSAPPIGRFSRAYEGRVFGVGQDPPSKLSTFAREHGLTFQVTEDPPPFPASRAYGIRVVPTTVLVDGTGTIDLVVESWDQDGLNALSRQLADLTGAEYVPISMPGDGMPVFRPG